MLFLNRQRGRRAINYLPLACGMTKMEGVRAMLQGPSDLRFEPILLDLDQLAGATIAAEGATKQLRLWLNCL